MATRSNNFEGGTNGTTITSGNSGGSSGDAFNAVIGTPTFSSTHARGTLSMAIVNATGTTYVEWSGLGSITSDLYLRTYLYLTAYPTTTRATIFRLQTAANGLCGTLRINTNGTISVSDATDSGGADGSVPIALNQLVRVEAHVIPGTSGGTFDWRLFNSAESTTTSDAVSWGAVFTLGANVDIIRTGLALAVPATPFTIYYDDVGVGTSGWLGPAVTVNKPIVLFSPVVTGSTNVGSLLTTTTGTWGEFDPATESALLQETGDMLVLEDTSGVIKEE